MLYKHVTGKLKQYRLSIMCLVAMAVLVAASPGWSQQKPVAKVNDAVLTEADLNEVMNRIIPRALFHGTVSEEKRDAYIPQAVEEMINDELLYQEARRTGLNVEKKVVDEQRKRTIERLGGKKNYRAALKEAGLTDREYRAKVERTLLIEKLLELEVASKATVSDDEVRKHYEDNRGSYRMPRARRLRHILIAVSPTATDEERESRRERAAEALQKIKDGEDMAKVAWDYSDDPYRVKGGDFGLIHEGRLAPRLEEEVFKLEEGELSEIIETIYGYHIARVEEVREPEQLSLEAVSEKIRSEISERRRDELNDALLKRLRANAKIEVYR